MTPSRVHKHFLHPTRLALPSNPFPAPALVQADGTSDTPLAADMVETFWRLWPDKGPDKGIGSRMRPG
jgi:hypothetical protein